MTLKSRTAVFGLCIAVIAGHLALGLGLAEAAQVAPISVTFEFLPPAATYAPGDDLMVNITARNTITSGDFLYDDLAYKEKVVNVSVHMGWMAPNEFAWNNVSAGSSWLEPDGAGVETYSVNLSVPDSAVAKTYSYYFRVEYLSHTPWGNITNVWGTDLTYHDFVVAEEVGAEIDYIPYMALAGFILAIGALGAVLYFRSDERRRRDLSARTNGAEGVPVLDAAAASTSYPIITAAPGEQFPVERGFLYLVKEKRPAVAFGMFNEAVNHGSKGMLVVREHPNRLKQVHEFQAAKILWLTRRAGVNHIDPTHLSLLNLEITKFVEGNPRSVILLEGLEYVITQNDFEAVLRFVNHLHDFVLTHDCAVIVVIDPRVLSTRELALLERAAKIVEPAEHFEPRNGRISEELEA
ncbi:MAG: DUF835 domain-containing protein [Thermoplasmata archaeon]|jgi:hypothetical protein|nr:DUF835 domain-containing protein [Thermoplasmata archaeon]